MIKIISFKICTFVQRVTALLEAKHVPYELEYIPSKRLLSLYLSEQAFLGAGKRACATDGACASSTYC